MTSHKNIAKEVERVHVSIDRVMRKVRREFAQKGMPTSCRPGCSHCCGQLFYVTMAEAVRIVDKLFFEGRRAELEALIPKLEAQRDYLLSDDATRAGWMKERGEMCVFLDEDSMCSVYEARPFPCRTYNALTPAEKCAPGYDGGDVASIDITSLADQYFRDIGLRSKRLQLPRGLPPFPIGILWAYVYVTKGLWAMRRRILEDGFESDEAIDMIFMRIIERQPDPPRIEKV